MARWRCDGGSGGRNVQALRSGDGNWRCGGEVQVARQGDGGGEGVLDGVGAGTGDGDGDEGETIPRSRAK